MRIKSKLAYRRLSVHSRLRRVCALQGAVNLSIDTMAVPDAPAAAVLVAYVAAVCAAAVLAGGE